MEAWILHIREEYIDSSDQISNKNHYSAWATTKQAEKEAARWLKNHTNYTGPFQDGLRQAIRSLLEIDKTREAIELINECSCAIKSQVSLQGYNKIHIIIEKSRFLGSAFE